jgi:CBS domain containing-hemolysin-like protein
MHVKHIREKSEKSSAKLQRLYDNRLTYIAACRLGSNVARLLNLPIVFLLLAPGAMEFMSRMFGWPVNYVSLVLAASVLMLPVGLIYLIFELIGKSYATLHPHGVGIALFRYIRLASLLFSVPAKLATGLANLFTARFGGKASFTMENQAEEEIKNIVEHAQESGEIEVDEKELLHSVFDFTDTVVREVMTPRVDIDAMPYTSTPEEIMEVMRTSGHSRIPIYEGTDDQIVGIIHVKDLFMVMLNKQTPNIRTLMRQPLFVPENKNLNELLREMRSNRSQMAVVQDEFGGTAGLVTIEDIVEELVGDIVDEYDIEEPEIVQVDGAWIADGKTHIDDLNDQIGSEFSSEEFDTVGGLVFGLFGRQPKPQEDIHADGYRFTVAETDGRRINKLRIEKLPEERETVEA